MREHNKNIILILISITVCITLFELLVRFIRPQPTYSILLSKIGGYWSSSSDTTFTLRPNYTGTQPSMEYPEKLVQISINSLGLRGAEPDDRPKVLIIGDSYTFGLFVDDTETYPAVLQVFLNKNSKNYQVLNAGYASGFDTDQQYVWLKSNIEHYKPKVVVLGAFLGNDIIGIYPDAWADIDNDGLPSKYINKEIVVTQTGILRDAKPTQNTVGVDWFYKVPIIRDSHLFIIAEKSIENIADSFKKKDTDKTSKQPYPEDYFQHLFGVYTDNFLHKEALFFQLVSAMNMLCKDNGVKFFVVLLPINFIVEKEKIELVLPHSKYKDSNSDYYKKVEKKLEDRNIPVLNIEEKMLDSHAGPFFPKNGEVHFNPNGDAFVGEEIYKFLQTGEYLSK